MPEAGYPEGAVSRADIVELAGLFDRFEFAIDPTSEDCRLAEAWFEDRVRQLYATKVVAAFPMVSLTLFRCRVRSLCRAYFKRNKAG